MNKYKLNQMEPINSEIDHICDMVGTQKSSVYTPVIFKQFSKIAQKRGFNIVGSSLLQCFCMDVFALGYMYGKHNERNKKSPVPNNGTVENKDH